VPEGLKCFGDRIAEVAWIDVVGGVAVLAGAAEAEREQVRPGPAEADAAGLVVRVQMLAAVPAAGLEFHPGRAGPRGRLGGEGGRVRADLRPGGAQRPAVTVAVGVAYGLLRVRLREP
jgi:hypothetical protein